VKWIKIALLLAVLAGLGEPTQAQPEAMLGKLGKNVEARFLFPAGRHFKYDVLYPLVLEYQNRSTLPQRFVLEWRMDTPVPSEYRDVVLEPGATKRLPFLFPAGMASQLYSVQVNEQNLTTDCRAANAQYGVTGLLAPAGDKLAYIRSLKVEKNTYYTPGTNKKDEEYLAPQSIDELEGDLLPNHWGALQSLDFLICHDPTALALSDLQYEAMIRWVEHGGTLVLISNGLPNEYAATPLADILPIEPKSTETADRFLRIKGALKDNAEVAFGGEADPLAVRAPVGLGTVYYITAPLLETEILGKEETTALWRQIFQATNQNPQYGGPFNYRVLDHMPELPRTQAGWVALFVLVYGIIVGPVNLTILRRKDKMLWSFITVPLVAILFAGSAYVVNRLIRPSSPVLREIGMMDISAQTLVAPARSEQLLFNPHSQTYLFESSPNTYFEIHQSNYRAFSEPRQFGLYEVTAGGGLKSDLEMGTWDIQRFNAATVFTLPSPFQIEEAQVSDKEGRVTITSPYASDGESAVISLKRNQNSDPFELKAGTHSYDLTFQKTSFTNLYNYDPKKIPGRETLLNSKLNSTPWQRERGFLLFFTDQIKTPITTNQKLVRRHDYLVTVEYER